MADQSNSRQNRFSVSDRQHVRNLVIFFLSRMAQRSSQKRKAEADSTFAEIIAAGGAAVKITGTGGWIDFLHELKVYYSASQKALVFCIAEPMSTPDTFCIHAMLESGEVVGTFPRTGISKVCFDMGVIASADKKYLSSFVCHEVLSITTPRFGASSFELEARICELGERNPYTADFKIIPVIYTDDIPIPHPAAILETRSLKAHQIARTLVQHNPTNTEIFDYLRLYRDSKLVAVLLSSICDLEQVVRLECAKILASLAD